MFLYASMMPNSLVVQLQHPPAHCPTPDMSARSQLQPLACWSDLRLWDADIQISGKHWRSSPPFRSGSSPPYLLKLTLGTLRCARPAACVDPRLPLDLDFGSHTTAQDRCENPGSDKYAGRSGAADGPHTDSKGRKSTGPSFWTSDWDRCFPSPAPQTTGALASHVRWKNMPQLFGKAKRFNKTKRLLIKHVIIWYQYLCNYDY